MSFFRKSFARYSMVLATLLSLFLHSPLSAEEPIKIGVQLALTGDLAQSGTDARNALMVANDVLGGGRYKLVFEDDQGLSKTAINVAHKLIHLEKVKYVLGLSCNQTLIATAPLYEKSGVFVLASGGGTSGDIPSLGTRNFRTFPSDYFGAETLFQYLRGRSKKLAILTEQTEYATMMERTFIRLNKESGEPLHLSTYVFDPHDRDLRTVLSKIKTSDADALYLNADSDISFMVALKQLGTIQFAKPRYAVYLPASDSVLKDIPQLDEGMIFSNLPKLEQMLSPTGKDLFEIFKKRYGEPLSGFPVVPPTFEAFRLLDLALRQGIDPAQFLREKTFKDGYLPPYQFDKGGNIIGLQFEMQRISNGKVEIFSPSKD